MNSFTPTALILAVTSDIGRAIAHRYAEEGYGLIVTARDVERLAAEVSDLKARYSVPVDGHLLDIERLEDHERLLQVLDPLPEVILCAIGLMPAQQDAQKNPELAARVMFVNYVGPALLLERIAGQFERRRAGTIIGISSVAGDRGRGSNYIYGSAKAGLTAFLSGLRNRMQVNGVQVITVNPGFVNTRMTEGMDLPRLLTAEPDNVAVKVWRAHQKGQTVVYVKPVWRWIMYIIRAIPEFVFKRTRL